MKFLFLRGRVPQDRDPSQIMFDNINDCDDVWTQLAYHISSRGYGEIWYWDGKRKVTYSPNFIERWIPKFNIKKYDFKPDVIFTRGGFKEYDIILRRNPQAFKIYYGAGKRFYPQSNFTKYNLILNDTAKQVKKTSSLFPNSRVELLLKPSADNVFKPAQVTKKIYDVIMVANENPKRDIKGHHFSTLNVPKEMNFIKVGISLKSTRKKNKHIKFINLVPRKDLPKLYAQSKVAIVCCNNVDSAPRVLIEAIACNCPILVLDNVNFWHKKYINSHTGEICSKSDFANRLEYMVDNYERYEPYKYYKEELSLVCASKRINSFIH